MWGGNTWYFSPYWTLFTYTRIRTVHTENTNAKFFLFLYPLHILLLVKVMKIKWEKKKSSKSIFIPTLKAH